MDSRICATYRAFSRSTIANSTSSLLRSRRARRFASVLGSEVHCMSASVRGRRPHAPGPTHRTCSFHAVTTNNSVLAGLTRDPFGSTRAEAYRNNRTSAKWQSFEVSRRPLLAGRGPWQRPGALDRGCVKRADNKQLASTYNESVLENEPSSGESNVHARIDAMSGATPKICITRFKLYASTCRLISVLTRGNVLVKKCVLPIQAFSVPKGCSTV